MGERTPLPSGHDGFEGWTVGPQLAEGLLQQEGDIPLAQPRPDGRPDAIERAAGDRGHRTQQLDLVGLLHDSELLDQPRSRHQGWVRWQNGRKSLVLVERQVLGLEADPPQPQCLEPLRNQRPEAVRRPRWHESEGRCLGLHLQPVAAVPEDFGGILADDQVAQAAAEPGEIADVLRRGHDQTIELEIEQSLAQRPQPTRRLFSAHRRS